MKLYHGNKSAINITLNPVQYDPTKHIEVVSHFIKEKLESGLTCTLFEKMANLQILQPMAYQVIPFKTLLTN